MNKDFFRIGGIAIVLVVVLGIAASFYRGSPENDGGRQFDPSLVSDENFVRPHSLILGYEAARVTVVEFLDPQCESCKMMHPLVKRMLRQYPDEVRLVIRYLPLHANSVTAVGALEAAREQGRFVAMLDALFVYQPVWGSHEEPKPELIPDYAQMVGLDMGAYKRFLDEGTFLANMEIDKADAEALGVRGTPSFFVNQRPLDSLGYEQLTELIDQELAE